MGLNPFSVAILTFGGALLVLGIAVGIVRARRVSREETRIDVALLIASVACGLLGVLVISAGVLGVVIPDSPCAAC